MDPKDAISSKRKTLSISNPVLYVVELNGESCRVKALVDSGSPVSFVKGSIFKKQFFQDEGKFQHSLHRFNTLASQPIEIISIVRSIIRLELFSLVPLNVDLNVLKTDDFEFDMVLGRDFLADKFTLTLEIPTDISKRTKIYVFILMLMFMRFRAFQS